MSVKKEGKVASVNPGAIDAHFKGLSKYEDVQHMQSDSTEPQKRMTDIPIRGGPPDDAWVIVEDEWILV